MQSSARLRVQSASNVSKRPGTGVFDWILTHSISRLVVPPLILVGLVASLITPLLSDLRQLSEDDLSLVRMDDTCRTPGRKSDRQRQEHQSQQRHRHARRDLCDG